MRGLISSVRRKGSRQPSAEAAQDDLPRPTAPVATEAPPVDTTGVSTDTAFDAAVPGAPTGGAQASADAVNASEPLGSPEEDGVRDLDATGTLRSCADGAAAPQLQSTVSGAPSSLQGGLPTLYLRRSAHGVGDLPHSTVLHIRFVSLPCVLSGCSTSMYGVLGNTKRRGFSRCSVYACSMSTEYQN